MNFLLDVFRDLWYEKIEEVTTAILTVPPSRVGGVYAPALTQHHPACFKRLKRKFPNTNRAKWCKIQIHAESQEQNIQSIVMKR